VVTKKNLLKMVISLVICDYAINLFIVLVGYRRGGEAPIFTRAVPERLMVDPLPQALVLTSIVIGLAMLMLIISICVRLYEKYNTLDITEIRKLRG
jgi:multicomponent Na+:H+ antiporter subunit C